MPRILAFVMDSAGVGALPDANDYHDSSNANTLGNVSERLGGLRLPNFDRLGLGHITPMRGLSAASLPVIRRETSSISSGVGGDVPQQLMRLSPTAAP